MPLLSTNHEALYPNGSAGHQLFLIPSKHLSHACSLETAVLCSPAGPATVRETIGGETMSALIGLGELVFHEVVSALHPALTAQLPL